MFLVPSLLGHREVVSRARCTDASHHHHRMFPFERFNQFLVNLIHSKKNPAADIASGLEQMLNARVVVLNHKRRRGDGRDDGCAICRYRDQIEVTEEQEQLSSGSQPVWFPRWSRAPRFLSSRPGTLMKGLPDLANSKPGLHLLLQSSHQPYRDLYSSFESGRNSSCEQPRRTKNALLLEFKEYLKQRPGVPIEVLRLASLVTGPSAAAAAADDASSSSDLLEEEEEEDAWCGAFKVYDDIYMGQVRLRSASRDQLQSTQCSYVRVAAVTGERGSADTFYVGEIQCFLDLREIANDSDYFLVYCKWFVAAANTRHGGVFTFDKGREVGKFEPFVSLRSIENVLMVNVVKPGSKTYFVAEHTRY